SNTVGEVPGRSAADRVEVQLAGFAQGHRHHAVLERQGREVDGIVLEPETINPQHGGKAVGTDQGSTADLYADRGLPIKRQQLPEAPHGLRPGLDGGTIQVRLDGIVIVIDFERAEVLCAKVQRLLGIQLATQTTLETTYRA